MLKIAICEDNAIHAEMILSVLKKELSLPCKTYIFSSGAELLASCSDSSGFDIICMDIQLEQDCASGIQFAQQISLSNPDTQIIFISQFLEYASPVYETKHVYFVYKEQLTTYLPKALLAAVKNLEKQLEQYLEFDFNKIHYRILQRDILYMERNLRTTYIHTKDRNIYSTTPKLQELQKHLQPFFCQCHRSFLINLNSVKTLNRTCAVLSDNTYIPIGRNYYSDIKKNFLML